MTDKLAVYNLALFLLGQRRLASLSQPSERRRVLDDLWPGVLQFCLEAGLWNFALRTATLASAGAGAMNYSNAFNKPADFVHLFTASAAPSFDPPLVEDFIDQGAQLFANGATLYIRYTSNDVAAGGGNLSLWSMTFATYVAHVLATWSAFRFAGKTGLVGMLDRRSGDCLRRALAIDSVAALPGLRPFNAEARSLPVEGHQLQPTEDAPFVAAAARSQDQSAARDGDSQ